MIPRRAMHLAVLDVAMIVALLFLLGIIIAVASIRVPARVTPAVQRPATPAPQLDELDIAILGVMAGAGDCADEPDAPRPERLIVIEDLQQPLRARLAAAPPQ